MTIDNVIKINGTICLLSSNGKFVYNPVSKKQGSIHFKSKKIVFNSSKDGKFVSVKVHI